MLPCCQLDPVALVHFTPQILPDLLSAPYKVYFCSLKLFFPWKPSSNPWCWNVNRVDLQTLCGARSPGSLSQLSSIATLFPFCDFHFHPSAMESLIWGQLPGRDYINSAPFILVCCAAAITTLAWYCAGRLWSYLFFCIVLSGVNKRAGIANGLYCYRSYLSN
jgi:hypothetical protein